MADNEMRLCDFIYAFKLISSKVFNGHRRYRIVRHNMLGVSDVPGCLMSFLLSSNVLFLEACGDVANVDVEMQSLPSPPNATTDAVTIVIFFSLFNAI